MNDSMKKRLDILIEVSEDVNKDLIVGKLIKLGYHYIPKPENPAPHMMFVKGYTMKGFKGQVYHIHVRHSGDWDELYFRDYLEAHPAVAQEYGDLKVKLLKDYRNDRDGYTDKKSDFINRITKIARKEKIVAIKKVSLDGA